MGQDNQGGQPLEGCEHEHTVTTVTAGLARTVCEACGQVSIRYDGTGAFWPEGPGAGKPNTGKSEGAETINRTPKKPDLEPPVPPKQPVCVRCEVPAVYMTPWGLACGEHAWQSASMQDPLSDSFWIPLLIDRSDISH